jgi:uncharacterized protein YfaS (alpha-2-macroglobulin family)
MNRKILVRIFGFFIILVLIFSLTESIFQTTNELPVEVPPGPYLIGQNPPEGQRLNLDGTIEITFDRDMEPLKTSNAFSFLSAAEPVAGEMNWLNARTFVFTPDKPLSPSTEYVAVINSTAAALDGIALREPIELEFTTIDQLAVAQVFPADESFQIDLDSTITVIFNHPIVPLRIEEEQADLPQPLKFTPPIKGTGEWLNSSVYVFQPEENLLSGVNYHARVKAGLKDTNGNPLDKPFEWQFKTRQPLVQGFYLAGAQYGPSGGVENVPLDQTFVIQFDQPMVPESVEAASQIMDRETQEILPVNFKWNDDFTDLVITPRSKFKLSSFYQWTLDANATAVDGGTLQEGINVKFKTVPYPSILGVFPKSGEEPEFFQDYIQVAFASNMNLETLRNRVQITPQPEGKPSMYFNRGDNILTVYGLAPSTDYIVRILPGMQDVYGNAIKDGMSFEFSTGAYKPYARLALPNSAPLIYRANGPQEFYFEHLNLEDASVSIFPMTHDEFYNYTRDEYPLKNFFPSTNAVREWKIDEAEKNQLFYEHFNFEQDGQGLETGFYFARVAAKNLEPDDHGRGYAFIVATDNLTFKATIKESLAWVTDLESGTPKSDVNVVFYDGEFSEIGSAKTNADGLVYLNELNYPSYAMVDDGKDFAFTSLYWGSGVSTYDLGIYQNYYGSLPELFGYLYTDRPVYRPDQDVYFKGILRKNDDLHYTIPRMSKVYVVVEQWGKKIFSEYVDVNDDGSFSALVHLADGVSLGSYTVTAYRSMSGYPPPIASVDFNVAEYRKPEFEVNVSPDAANMLAGETVNFGLDATYYSGGNLGEAKVEWQIESNYFYFSPAAKYRKYGFSDWQRDLYYSPTDDSNREIIQKGEGLTNENGHLDIPQLLDFKDDTQGRILQFRASVTDVAGNTVTGSTSMIMQASELHAGIRANSSIGTEDQPSTFDVVVLDWDSNPVAEQVVTVKFVQRKWFSVRKRDNQGQLRWETSVQEVTVGTVNSVTDQDGKAQVTFTPPSGGVYKAVVTVEDSNGNKNQASAYTWVGSNEYIPWRRTNDRSFELIADKDVYFPGDTAELLIAQPFEGKVHALVTYERGHIYKQEVIQLEGSSTVYKLPITDELAPVAYISVTVIGSTEAGGGSPDYKIGMARINIDTTQKTLDVTVTADKKSAGPGEEVTYTIQTNDINGNPVSADVSLALVDKAALALAPPNSAPLLASFYPVRGLAVMTSVGLISNADKYNENYVKTIPDGARMGGGGGGEPGIITVRENFKDTAGFEAHVVTDMNGRAQVTIKLPENLTTWHADVRAITLDSRVGEAEHELISTKPLFIQLQTPRFFVVGDQVQVGAIVHNNTNTKLNVTTSLEALGLLIKSDVEQQITLAAKQQAYVTWEVVANQVVTRADLTATATSGAFTDASKPPLGTLTDQGIPVLNFVVRETVGTSGMITSANSATELIQLPETYHFTDANLNIEMAPSLSASMQSGLTYLENYQYLCMEQTVSRFLANVITSRALKLQGIEAPLNDNLDEQVAFALQRIYARQKSDGGWNWWDGEESDAQTSAYVIYGLLEARESGYEISESVIQRGIDYLENNLPNLRRTDETWEFNRHAFMMYVLARGGRLDSGQTNLIFENRHLLSLYGTAYLAQTLFLLDPQDPRIPTLMSDLETAAILSSSGTHWEENSRDHWNWNTDTRTTAIVLNTFVQINPQNLVSANAVRWLMAGREDGHWYSTQETTWSLIALTNWMVASKEYETDYKYSIGLNGELLEEGQATADNLTKVVDLKIELKDLLKEEANRIVFTRGRGDGNLYYTAQLTASLQVDEVEALDQGMTLIREYFALDDPETPITEIEQGELVKVRLTMVVPSTVRYVVVDDPLPGGLEAVDSTLLTDVTIPESYSMEDYHTRGWGWWYFRHVELRDEKIVLSTSYLPAGTYVYTYLARASTVGTFNVIPPTASEFYFPDVGGRGAGSVFIVK